MNRVELEVRGIVHKDGGFYILLLGVKDSQRCLSVVLGNFEAYNIYILYHHKSIPRPSTTEFIHNMMQAFHIDLKEVFIASHRDGVFFADVHCVNNQKHLVLDSRCSDAVLLALQFGCPIYTTEDLVEQYGNEIEDEPDDILEAEEDEDSLSELYAADFDTAFDYQSAMEEEADLEKEDEADEKKKIQIELNNALAAEDYELAAILYKRLNNEKD